MDIYWPSFFFYMFSVIACAFAVAVVLTPNIVRMAFYLVMSLAATAGLFFVAGADFVGSMQILIYVGGTLVLLVFGVMLVARPVHYGNQPREMLVAGGGACCWPRQAARVSLARGLADRAAPGDSLQPTVTPIGAGC
jgi:NADH:ubiquinone oxidoreductase subunit 6 (subunit J)